MKFKTVKKLNTLTSKKKKIIKISFPQSSIDKLEKNSFS